MTNSQQSDVVDSTNPSDNDLLAFIESEPTVKDGLAAIGFPPEMAVQSKKTRPILVEAYWKHQDEQEKLRQEQDSAHLAQAEDAAAEMLEATLFGITPEVKKRHTMMDWVVAFGGGQLKQPPKPRTNAEGKNLCATAGIVPCCDGQSEVGAFMMISNIAFIGICQSMVEATKEVVKQHGPNALLYYMNLATANRRVAEAREAGAFRDWILSIAHNGAKNLPVQRKSEFEGKHLCGLPDEVRCCNHKEPVNRYHAYNGMVYGLCKKAASAYEQCFNDTGIKSIRPTRSLSETASFAEIQIKDQPLHKYVDRFVSSETAQTNDDPGPRYVSEEDKTLCCGLPDSIECCDKQTPAEAFPTLNGVVYGLCEKAAWAYREGRNRHGDSPFLMYVRILGKANDFARQWRERNGFDDSDVDFGPKSPLGNKTEPDSLQKYEIRRAERSAHDAEVRASMKGSGQGGGKKNGNGKKNR
jgi:hypothetical protein